MKLTRIVVLNEKPEIFFMLTEPCRAQSSETPCDQLRLGDMSFQRQYSFIGPGSFRTQSAPGYRITKHVKPSRFTYIDLEKYVENLDELKLHSMIDGRPAPNVAGHLRVNVYIYCPPCACQIATALDICQYSDRKDFVEFNIRIDPQQMTACSMSVSRIEGLISVIEHLKELEKGPVHDDDTVSRLKSIDREWLERQVYDHTEEDRLSMLSPKNQLARVAEFHSQEHSCAAIIILGEADFSIPLMEAPPFRPFESGRLPRETQLFRCCRQYNSVAQRSIYEREYMGTYSPRAPLPPKQPPPVGPNKSHAKESPERATKRPRSSIPDEENS